MLARAAARVLAARPEARFLFVGDGAQRSEAEGILKNAGYETAAIFTGLVPQEEGPEHLAAMDLLVSPHVPNPDGSPFFGSPTKLFEYMAAQRPVVASDIPAFEGLLAHEHNALLCEPDRPEALASTLETLLGTADRGAGLAEQAWRDVQAFTWEARAGRVLERFGGGPS